MTQPPLAGMSAEAARVLAEAEAAPSPSHNADLSIEDMRRETRAAYAPASQKAIKKTGVSCADVVIADVPCMKITPPNPQDGRQFLYLFGGAFMLGSPFEDLPISATLSAATGATVICPSYRLAPEHPFPAALDDVTVVATAVLANNPATLLVGESAGGNLALALVHRLRAAQASAPQAIVALSPATDLEHRGDSHLADRDPFLRQARTHEVRQAYVAGQEARSPEISPIYGAFDPGFPPTMVTTGTRDLLLSGCVRLARVMREAGAEIDLRVWEGMWHVFEFYLDVPEATQSLAEIAAFLNRHFADDLSS